jgi:hypothetical protein
MNPPIAKLLFIAAAAGIAPFAAACTSWIVHPSVSASGRMLVHKCRDSKTTPLGAEIRRAGGVKWMRIGWRRNLALFGVNEYGVVAVMNDGEDVTSFHERKKNGKMMLLGSGWVLRQIMTECKNAEESLRILRHYGESGTLAGRGQTMLVADPRHAFMVELGPRYAAVKELTGGMLVIANSLHLPGIESTSLQTDQLLFSSRTREANARAELRKRRVDGKYTVKGSLETSRFRCQEPMTAKYPCRANSLGGCCFELDPEFPAELTTAYIALGPQQHTVYLPTPLGLEQFPEEILDGSWADLAYKLRESEGYDHRFLARFAAFEETLLPEYDRIREKARTLLREGKKSEAVKLLNDCYRRQYDAALKLMREVAAESEKNPAESPKIEAET